MPSPRFLFPVSLQCSLLIFSAWDLGYISGREHPIFWIFNISIRIEETS
jgi:hypothetical protein